MTARVTPVARDDGLARVTVGGLPIVRASRADLARLMLDDVARARGGMLSLPRVLTSANGNVIAAYHADASFRQLVDQADIIDADGMPLVMATRLLCRQPLAERIATTDFLLDAAGIAAEHGVRFFFLGGRPGVAARAAEYLRSRFAGLCVTGTHHGYFPPERAGALCDRIRSSGTDVLWVGMGNSVQERFAVEHRARLGGLAWVRTCGGLFDHYGGGVSRAPAWMQATATEWLYRAAREPVRLGWRYLVTNPVALYHLATKTHD